MIGNNDSKHPHSLFAMNGSITRPSFRENDIPSIMISYDASHELMELVKESDREMQVGKMYPYSVALKIVCKKTTPTSIE